MSEHLVADDPRPELSWLDLRDQEVSEPTPRPARHDLGRDGECRACPPLDVIDDDTPWGTLGPSWPARRYARAH